MIRYMISLKVVFITAKRKVCTESENVTSIELVSVYTILINAMAYGYALI